MGLTIPKPNVPWVTAVDRHASRQFADQAGHGQISLVFQIILS
jgi:hypothetical protein